MKKLCVCLSFLSLLTLDLRLFSGIVSESTEEKPELMMKENPKRIEGGKFTVRDIMNTHSLNSALRVFTNHFDPAGWKVDLLKRAHHVLEQKENANFDDLLKDKEFRNLFESNGMTLLGGPMLGQITETSAAVWVRTFGVAEVSIQLSEGEQTRVIGPVKSRAENDYAVTIPVIGLKQNSAYDYRVLLNGEAIEGKSGVIKTTQSEQTRIAFGSCPHRWGLGRQQIWAQVLSRDPSALLMFGDIAVQDRNTSFGLHRFDYLMRDMLPPFKNLSANLPMYTVWDDHDFLDNDLPKGTKGVNDEQRFQVRHVFKNSWNNPQYGFDDERGGVFHKSRIGPADIIMTDNRYFRGHEGPYFGEPQMQWLEQELLKCEGPFIVLVCGTLWNDAKGNGKDSWGMYDQKGRERILSFIEKHKIPGVILVSGDWHGARAYTIKRPSGYTFYEFQPASLGCRHGATTVDNTLFALSGKYAFGELTFDAKPADPTAEFRLMLEDGSEYYKMKLKRSQLTPQ